MRAPKVAVIVPVPSSFPSGGNVFNARVLAGLPELVDVSVHTVRLHDALPAIERRTRVLIDTLLLADAESLLARAGDCGLLVHLLALFDPATRDGPRARLERQLLPDFSFFVTTSEWAAHALRDLGVQGPIEVVYPGLDDDFLQVEPAPRGARVPVRLLTVANLLPAKGLIELATILKPLAALPFTWTVVGNERLDAAYARRFHAACIDTGLAQRSRVIEASPEAMRALYDASDVLVSGARFETLGMALREAMARALPLLGWDVGGCSESVIDGETGYLVPLGDTGQFTARLRDLIEQPALRDALGANARALAATFPTWREARHRFAAALKG